MAPAQNLWFFALAPAEPGKWVEREAGITRPWARRPGLAALAWVVPTGIAWGVTWSFPEHARLAWVLLAVEVVWIAVAIAVRLREKPVRVRKLVYVSRTELESNEQ